MFFEKIFINGTMINVAIGGYHLPRSSVRNDIEFFIDVYILAGS